MGVGSYLSTKSEHELMEKRGESAKDEPSPVINGVTTYVSFIIFGLIPLLIYAIDAILGLELTNLFTWAIGLTTLAFVVIGILKSKVAQSNVGKAILETLILGVIAAAFAYFAGDFLEQLISK
jgi:vacuolar iron transporter family protein